LPPSRPLPRTRRLPFSGGQCDVVEVEANDLADAQPGVEGQQRHDGVAGAAAVFGRAQVAHDLTLRQGLGRSTG
jgi:hypothetical protein